CFFANYSAPFSYVPFLNQSIHNVRISLGEWLDTARYHLALAFIDIFAMFNGTAMTSTDDSQLRCAVAAGFYEVNGTHPMTVEDDAYASEWYVQSEALADTAGISASELRRLMLADRLPLPSYIQSDGTQM